MRTNKKGAMEMTMGTMVTIVLLVSVLVLGLVLVQKIFTGATESADSINDQTIAEISNLFNTQEKDLAVSLGTQHSAKVKQGSEDFGFIVGFAPDNPAELNAGGCYYNIEAQTSGDYCTHFSGWTQDDVEDWILTGVNNVNFDEIQKNVGYALIKLNIPDEVPKCTQRYNIEVRCSDGYSSSTWFDLNVIKKGIL